ncbi:MAG: hypothetical protein ACRD30_05375 [Bryobacteraceae bacterium]
MIHTLIPYSLLAFGLLGSLALFLNLKRELHSASAKSRKRLEEFAAQIAEFKKIPEPIQIPAPPRSAMNFNTRMQAMRMLRRNQDASHIAAALGLARSEVELLIRVHQISSGATAKS